MKNHLDTFTIHAFRGLKELTLDGLGKVNILVGDNNSGKTSVLEAIRLVCNPLSFLELCVVAQSRNSIGSNADLLHSLQWMFPVDIDDNSKTVAAISFNCKGKIPFQAYSVTKEDLLMLTTDPIGGAAVGTHPAGGGMTRQGGHFLMTLQSNSGSANEEFTYWRDVIISLKEDKGNKFPCVCSMANEYRESANLAMLYSTIYEQNLIEELVILLNIFDSSISNVILLEKKSNGASVYIEHKKTGTSPVSSFGDGLRKALFLAMQLLSCKNGIFLVDEFDNAIHHTALISTARWLIQASKMMNVQLVLTTHNLEALDALLAASQDEMLAKDDLVAYRLKEGGQLGKRFSGAKLHSIRYDYGYDVR